jgi:hypothetical protein
MSIKDLLKENISYRCLAYNSFQLCSTEHGAYIHFSRKHNLEDSQKWRSPIQKIGIKTEIVEESQNVTQNFQNDENHPNDHVPSHTATRSFSHIE